MTSRLGNGAVLPTGLLANDMGAMSEGFKKNYQNSALRFGVVTKSYPKGSPGNILGLSTEYDVMVFEQNENKSATPQTYKNCLSSESLGSLADFFETTLRVQTKKGSSEDAKGQDGAVVLVLCLNAVSGNGIIIGSLTHPDRKTTLIDNGPHLEGEFNGVNIKVNKDGSTSLTFKGATDNDGKPTDATQGDTELKIETDGTYQLSNKGVTQRLEKGGIASLTAKDNINNITDKTFNVKATENITLEATKNFNLTAQEMAAKISGSASFECQIGKIVASGDLGIKASYLKLEAESLVNVKAPVVIVDAQVALGGTGGLPILTLSTTMFGIGNLGLPVLVRAISGFSTRVTAK